MRGPAQQTVGRHPECVAAISSAPAFPPLLSVLREVAVGSTLRLATPSIGPRGASASTRSSAAKTNWTGTGCSVLSAPPFCRAWAATAAGSDDGGAPLASAASSSRTGRRPPSLESRSTGGEAALRSRRRSEPSNTEAATVKYSVGEVLESMAVMGIVPTRVVARPGPHAVPRHRRPWPSVREDCSAPRKVVESGSLSGARVAAHRPPPHSRSVLHRRQQSGSVSDLERPKRPCSGPGSTMSASSVRRRGGRDGIADRRSDSQA